MTILTRRRALQLSGAAAAGAWISSGRTPAFAQGTTLHWLKPVDFVPASDQLIKGKLKEECQKTLGITLNLETVDGNSVQARTTSAIQSGSGPDIIMELNNWAQLYGESLADVSDIADEVGKAQGGFYDVATAVGYDGKKWIGLPFTILGAQIANRKSWWGEIGIAPDKYPTSWDDYRAAGKKLKAAGHPIGQTLAHTYGDAPTFWYPYMWSWGGKEVENDGKTVVLNSKETVESVKFAVQFWKDCCDEGGMAWDDSGNNRAFLSNTISATLNGASIYLLSKQKPDTYQTDKGTPLKDDIFHTRLPKGPAGEFSYHLPFVDVVPKYGKNQKAAKDFLRWFHSKEIYGAWFTSQQGFSTGVTKMWQNDPVWQVDPIMAPYRTAIETGRFAGYSGPSTRPAAEAISKYIIVDMYAKAVQGTAPEEAVKWAHSELVKIYA